MIDWIKPSGATITTNDTEASIGAAAGLGWKQASEAKKHDNSTSDSKRGSRKARR
jgi:hypothetical protein